MSTKPDFWNGLAKKYAAQPVDDPAAYERKLQMTQELLTPDMDVLEIACGTGTTALTHAPHVKSIRAIDYSAEMIGIARGKAAQQGTTNVEFAVEAIDDLPTRTPYDMVQAHSILHLMPDHRATISKIFEITKPGGWFISSSSCIGEANPLLKLALPVARWMGKAPFVALFSAAQLVDHIKQAGFEVETEWRATPNAAVFVVARKPT